MSDGKVIAASQVIVLLYDALEIRDYCDTCGGTGDNWTDGGPHDSPEPDPCECTINAVSILEHCKDSYINAQLLLEGLKL